MFYTLIGLLLALQATLPVTGQMNYEAAERYMQIACEYTGGECPDVPIVYSTFLPERNWGRYYQGSNIVWLADGCRFQSADKDFCHGVLIHEMVHYIVNQQGRMQHSACVNEQFAWAIYNQYELEIGRPDLVRLNWRKGYPQCQSGTTGAKK